MKGLKHRERIASGAYGIVYRASSPSDEHPRKHYAIKRLLVSKQISFCSSIREMDLVMSCQNHPFIVKCYGLAPLETIFEGDKPRSERSDYKDDASVQVYDLYLTTLDKIYGNIENAELFFFKLLIGVEYLHGCGIVHRDIKPSNIMVDIDCNPKIGDFGQAQRVELVNSDMSQTLRYRAPELLARKPHKTYDPRASDIWALGCIFYELKHAGSSFFEIPSGKLISESSFLISIKSSLPHSESSFLNSIFQIDPNDRPTASQLIQDPIFSSFLNEQKIRVSHPPFTPSVDNLIIPESPMRQEVCKIIRSLTLEEDQLSLMFHTLEVIDRLLCSSEFNKKQHSARDLFLSVSYIIHKYLAEEHIKEALSFESFCQVLKFSLTSESQRQKPWENLETKILNSLKFVIYRKTPYEQCRDEDLRHILNVYTFVPSGIHFVGDIITAARHINK